MKYLLPLFVLFSCTPIGNHVPPDVDKPAVKAEYKADWPKKEWTDIFVAALKANAPELLKANPPDLKDYCPSGDKIQAYVAIASSMARYESSFIANKEFKESFDVDGKKCAATGKPCVISTGIMQISFVSANGYGCGFKTQKELHDPKKHLECVAKMFQRRILKDGAVSASGKRGLGAYWSVLQYGNQYQKIDPIKKRSRELCAK